MSSSGQRVVPVKRAQVDGPIHLVDSRSNPRLSSALPSGNEFRYASVRRLAGLTALLLCLALPAYADDAQRDSPINDARPPSASAWNAASCCWESEAGCPKRPALMHCAADGSCWLSPAAVVASEKDREALRRQLVEAQAAQVVPVVVAGALGIAVGVGVALLVSAARKP